MSVLNIENRQRKYYFKAHHSCPSSIEVEISDDVTNLYFYFRRINLSLASSFYILPSMIGSDTPKFQYKYMTMKPICRIYANLA